MSKEGGCGYVQKGVGVGMSRVGMGWVGMFRACQPLPCDLSHDASSIPTSTSHGQTATCENITFPELRWWVE